MKNIFFIIIVSFNLAVAQQSYTINPSAPNDLSIFKKNIGGLGFDQESSNGQVRIGTYITIEGAYIQTHSNHNLNFRTSNAGPAQLTFATNDNVGVGVPNPTAKLHVDGFTKLGSNAPAIKMLKFTGTTAAFSVTTGPNSNFVTIPHGIPAEKILSVSVVVDLGPAGNVFANYTQTAGYEIDITYNNAFLYVWNIPTNSANILSKPFKVLITYKE